MKFHRHPQHSRFACQRIGCVLVLCACSAACAQPCSITETIKIDAPLPASDSNEFGASVAMEGDWAIVGAPSHIVSGDYVGAAYILHRDGTNWSIVQTIHAPPDTPSPEHDRFGAAVAMRDGWAFIGSPRALESGFTSAGAAHVYALQDEVWTHVQRLAASDAQANVWFGNSLAADSGHVVIGAKNDNDLGTNSGSAYVFQFDGRSFVQMQKLLAPNGVSNDAFGSSVSISGDAVLVGAPLRDAAGVDSGAAYVFRLIESQWVLEQLIPGWAPMAGDRVGTAVAIEGDLLVVGLPGRDLQLSDMGEAHAYKFDGNSWSLLQILQGPAEYPIVSKFFGSAIALRWPFLVVGAERSNVYPFPYYSGAYPGHSAGAGTLYLLNAGLWTERFSMRESYVEVINQSTFLSPIAGHTLGAAAAIGTDTVMLGAPMNHNVAGGGIGWALLFDIEPPDCDANGIPDACESDCNHNLIADICELNTNSVPDCDLNGVPDGCDSGFDYVVDDGTAGIIYGPGTCPGPGRDFIWLNQFNVLPGGQMITHVAAAWSSYSPEGTPATVLIYDDPNNDGDPADAVLLATVPAVAHDAFGLNPNVRFTSYSVPTTTVGQIGDSFFVGMHMAMPCNVYGAVLDVPSPAQNRSWKILAPFGTANIHELTANEGIQHLTSGNWAVRAIALDCDANGTWDQCDIDTNPLLDLNNNGILDSCDLPCSGDIAGGGKETDFRDGTVSIDDLLVIINHWDQSGPPGTVPGDIAPPGPPTGDGIVNIDDLLIIVNTWGTCP